MARKSKSQRLDVYQNSKRVGSLERAVSGAISFSYAEQFLSDENNSPVSLSLSLQEAPFKGSEVSSYFENLLPDNIDIRNVIAQKTKAESSKTFDLLAAIGHDCIGALQFLIEGSPAPKIGEIKGKRLSDKEIETTLENLAFSPLGLDDKEPDFRISIAGAQEKTALLRLKGKWLRPEGSTPTTHILKPPMGILHNGIDLTTSVENEWLCLEIARTLGLKVAKCEMEIFGKQKCLVLERFDREWITEGKIYAAHKKIFVRLSPSLPTESMRRMEAPACDESWIY